MHWLLVVIVTIIPVKTDLVFDSLNGCLTAEQDMRAQWTEIYNRSVANKHRRSRWISCARRWAAVRAYRRSDAQ